MIPHARTEADPPLDALGASSAARNPAGPPVRVLIAEDDLPTSRLIAHFLRRAGYTVIEAPDAATARSVGRYADVAILDVMLPDGEGWALLGELRREQGDLPVLFLTALATREDELRGLRLGGDDYLRKPVDLLVLRARLEAVLARSGRAGRRAYPGMVIDFAAREVTVDGVKVDLTRTEFDLLSVLASQPQRVFSRTELLDRIWGSDFEGTLRVVDARLNTLRRKLGEDGHRPRFVAAIRGVGYRFRAADES